MWTSVRHIVQRSKSDDDGPGAAAGTVFGSWHRFLPLLDTNHSAAAPSSGNMTATLLTLKATNQRLFGLDVSSCQALALFARFLAEAERIYPELRVFACLSSHSPIFEYCAAYWDTSGPAKGKRPRHSWHLGCILPRVPNIWVANRPRGELDADRPPRRRSHRGPSELPRPL